MSDINPRGFRQPVEIYAADAKRIAELEAERDRLADKMERAMIAVAHFTHSYNQDLETIKALREALEDAPHERYCLSEWERNMFRRKEPQPNACDCWKARIPQPTPQSLAASSDHGCNSPVSLSEDKSATDLRQSSGKRAGNNQ